MMTLMPYTRYGLAGPTDTEAATAWEVATEATEPCAEQGLQAILSHRRTNYQVGLYARSHAGVMEMVINNFYPQEGVAKSSVQMALEMALECIEKWAFETYKSPARLVPKYNSTQI